MTADMDAGNSAAGRGRPGARSASSEQGSSASRSPGSSPRPGCRSTVFEKEAAVATHQTGHNSGVVHAGIYYAPGSAKARMTRRGVGLLKAYCTEKGLAYSELGKLVVARTRARWSSSASSSGAR